MPSTKRESTVISFTVLDTFMACYFSVLVHQNPVWVCTSYSISDNHCHTYSYIHSLSW